MQSAGACGIGVGQQFGEPLTVGRRVADDKHVVPRSDRIEPLSRLVDRAGKRLHRCR